VIYSKLTEAYVESVRRRCFQGMQRIESKIGEILIKALVQARAKQGLMADDVEPSPPLGFAATVRCLAKT